MILTYDLIILLVAGLSAGFLAGLLGVGGGIIFVPVLSWYLGKTGVDSHVEVIMVIANSLALACIMGISGTLSQKKKGYFFPAPTLALGLGGAVTSVATAYLISHTQVYDKRLFGIVFSILLIPLIVKMFRAKESEDSNETSTNSSSNFPRWRLLLIGLLTGVVSALSGLGGGVIMIPLLNSWAKFSMRKSGAISLSSIVILSFFMSLYYMTTSATEVPKMPLTLGYIHLPVLLPLALGITVSAPFGVKMAHKVNGHTIKWIFVALFTVILIQMNW